jgi:hypothetical protein
VFPLRFYERASAPTSPKREPSRIKPGGKPSGILPCERHGVPRACRQAMSVSELNKRVVREFFEQVFNEGRLELIDELVAKDFIGRLGCVAPVLNGPAELRQFVSTRRAVCRGLHIRIEDQIAEDDRVVTRWRASARPPQSPVDTAGGDPPPRCAGITIIRLLAGKQVEARTQCAGPHADGVPTPPN